jgi:dTDP-4-amino-4,6-dideoxygalactose transaminase
VIPFHRPSIGSAEIIAAVEVLASNWLTTGPRVQEFENAFALRLGVGYALAVNSATAALHLALEGMGVGPGDDVVVPTLTFTACGEVVNYLGANVVLAEVGEDGLLGPEQLERAITPKTKAVMPVHFAGLGVDIDALRKVWDGPYLEDAAHALPATVNDRNVGTLGDAAAFSFYATKTMTTGGEGGMLVTNNPDIAKRAKMMRLHGISSDAWDRYGARGKWAYVVEEAGYKYNLTDLSAAIGLAQLRRLDELWEKRATIAARYDAAFADNPNIQIPPRTADQHSWHLYVIRVKPLIRDVTITRLATGGIGASVHFIPLNLMPYYQRQGYAEGDFSVAERLYSESISLPIWPDMTETQVNHVISAVEDATCPS